MAENEKQVYKLDYTIQIDEDQYDVTAADSLHADLANQVENALVVKQSVRKTSIDSIKNNESLAIENLQANIGVPSEAIGVTEKDAHGNLIPIVRDAANAFAFKGDYRAEIEVVPSSGGVFTGPIYAPDIDADDGFNINKFQVTNYNSVDTVIRELKGFPVYKWTGTEVLALTEGAPPTMLPFKVIIYTGPTSGTTDYWTDTARADLKLVNGNPDGTTTDCTTDGKFFLINAKDGHPDYGRILLGTYNPEPEDGADYCTYEELRVKEADHAKTLATAMGDKNNPIYLNTNGVPDTCNTYAGGTNVTLNGAPYAASTAIFYAPEGSGTAKDVLLSQGENTTPTWSAQSSLHVGSASNVTTQIGGKNITTIFETDGTTVKNATNASNVTEKIDGELITDIFESDGTTVQNATNAAQAAKAATADKADKLYIYSAGGSTGATTATKFTGRNDSYIIYSRLDPPTSTDSGAGTNLPANANLLKEGNIFIKLES
jgi:hypothetical protein